MSSGKNLESAQSGCPDQEDVPLTTGSVLSCGDGVIVRQDEGEGDGDDDEGDVGFNPCLEELPSSDGSSSLSSEVDGVEAGIGGIEVNSFCNTEVYSLELTEDVRSAAVGKLLRGATSAEVCEVQLPDHDSERLPAGELEAASHTNDRTVQQEEGQRSDEPAFIGWRGEDMATDGKTSIASDDEDAIFKRTRARYSLAGFTLEELESFLQETDDEDDLRNIDDEEEYRKFLASVLRGGDGDGQLALPTGVVDDEDEDNDADFEIELEEALESDVDETPADKNQKGCHDRFSRRPETRQNRRQKVNVEQKRKILELGRRPLRPLLPLLPVGYDVTSTSCPLPADTPPSHTCFTAESCFVNGFTPHQLGQLYCLIHEHVQLLIQIFSLCILDSSRQQIASVVQELLFEVLQKHEEALARRSAPYGAFCFSPPYVFPTVQDQPSRLSHSQHTLGSHPSSDAQIVDLSPDDQIPTVLHDSQINEQRKSGVNGGDGAVWLPYVSGPVLSIIDVAPLRLVKNYIQNVTLAVRENHRRRVESSFDILSEREPLFALPSCPSTTEGDKQVPNVSGLPEGRNCPSSPGQQQFKRSLASTLMESTKKQSVALVPKEIAKLAQIFYPLFNRALFPRKPPLASVTNRVLFTDAEDELLALGMMEYNTDWKAIQQRFLPCKSKHQIFVRQKNRCSSKAPENPIKAVRRMKTSPLTAEEMQYIQEGLKIYKLDWMSVWKYVVPHRDPSLLPRQWRIAMGVQKSYKVDPAKKQKRCKYEAERRRRAAILGAWQVASEKEDHNARGENSSGDDCVDDPDEAYVHEAFLADWTPGTLSQGTNDAREQSLHHMYGEGLNQSGNRGGLPFASSCMRTQAASPGSCASTSFVNPVSCRNGRTSIPPLSRQSRKGCRVESACLVKLAPNLPPVNLPQNVRVISASAYHHSGAVLSLSVAEARADLSEFKSASHRSLQMEGLEMMHVRNTKNDTSMAVAEDGACLESEDSAMNHEKRTKGERDSNTGIPMHPLLFQAPENATLPYYLRNSSGLASTSLNFFSPNPPQLNLSLFHNSPQQNQVVTHFYTPPKPSCSTSHVDGIDFHPLLGRTDSTSTEMLHKQSRTELSARLSVPQARKQATGGSLAALTSHSDQVDKSNELDLNIHLNSSPGKTVERSDEATHKKMWRVGDRTPIDHRERKDPSTKDPENFSLISCKPSGSVGTHINSVRRCDVDIVGDQSHPEIVMEQEELSDSEEDTEENVEFECEEMADSDGEDESDTDLPANSLNKAIQHPESEDPSALANDDHEHESTASHVDRQVKGNLLIAKLGPTGEVKDITSKSWLSLDPCAGGRLSNAESEQGANTICKENVDEGHVAPPSSRSRKRTRPNSKCDVAELRNQSIGCAKQEQLDQVLSIGPLRRPRKRSCGKNASSNSVKAAENSNFLAKGNSTD